MEEPQQGSLTSNDWSAKTGEALRVLRSKLATRQDPDSRTATETQADIIAKIFQIAEEMAVEQSMESQATAQLKEEKLVALQSVLAEREELISQLQSQLSDSEQERNRFQHLLEVEKASANTRDNTECSECSALRASMTEAQQRALAAETTVDQLKKEASRVACELAELQSCREVAAASEEEISRLREKASHAEQRCSQLGEELASLLSERDLLADDLAAMSDNLTQQLLIAENIENAHRAELTATTQEQNALELNCATLEQERDEIAANLREATATITQLEAKVADLAANCEKEVLEERSKNESLQEQINNLHQERDQFAEELARVQEAAGNVELEKDVECEDLKAELTEARKILKQVQVECTNLSTERDQFCSQLESLRSQMRTIQADSTAETAEWEAENADLKAQLTLLAGDKQQLAMTIQEQARQLAEYKSQYEEATSRLQEAEGHLRELPDLQEQTEEISKLQKMFELARADVQKLKRENAELHEELEHRVEVSEIESPELLGLRLERDALAARVAELESSPPQPVDEATGQEMADLQRRFELAVDDLRQLKQEKAELEEKLAKSTRGSVAPADCGSLDWQAQKARLLASLESEEEAENPSPERSQDLLTIQGTIETTDQVIAEKDNEIAELRAQLAKQMAEKASDPSEFVNQDEIVQAERVKLEQLQAEWKNKLREAELEMATQRAALARKEVELKDLLATAEEAAADAALANDGKPRRRWLFALGLGEEEQKET